jgi:hypothetical protein
MEKKIYIIFNSFIFILLIPLVYLSSFLSIGSIHSFYDAIKDRMLEFILSRFIFNFLIILIVILFSYLINVLIKKIFNKSIDFKIRRIILIQFSFSIILSIINISILILKYK